MRIIQVQKQNSLSFNRIKNGKYHIFGKYINLEDMDSFLYHSYEPWYMKMMNKIRNFRLIKR